MAESSLTHTLLKAVGIEPITEPEGRLLPYYIRVSAALQLTAAAVSYYRHRDLTWALIHGFMGPVYLSYVAVEESGLGDLVLPVQPPEVPSVSGYPLT